MFTRTLQLMQRPTKTLFPIKVAKMSTSEDEVMFQEFSNKCTILLNRPKALNALNLTMIRKIYPVMKQWNFDGKDFILIEGAGDKAFCAGGDVRAVAESSKNREANPLSKEFFYEEYQLNHLIATLKVPYIALIHGITMGGGVGLSIHGHFRVASDKTLFAMPETAIGLFPDVGGTYVLSRMKDGLGMYLALTGYRLKGFDTIHAGIATHFVFSDQLPKLHASLLNLPDNPGVSKIEEVLHGYSPKTVPDFSLKRYQSQIKEHFCLSSVEEIIQSLEGDSSEWAQHTKGTMLKMSPTSLKITFEALKRGKTLSLEDCFSMEYRLSQHCMLAPDFYEGVRAVLIDKDQNPKWKPSKLEEVSEERVKSFFQQIDGVPELKLN
ncbi:3-hydroxyisobutyryl-CoA hydrolase, mitochondrial-like isoform X2 [Artemia franciscana]